MSEPIWLDAFTIVVTVHPSRTRADQDRITKVLTRGGFLPRLRKLVRELAKSYPELRRATMTVKR